MALWIGVALGAEVLLAVFNIDERQSGDVGMPDHFKQIIAFCARRYYENRDNRPRLARAYLAIVNKATDVQLSTNNIGGLLDFLYEPPTDPDLAKASRDVLERVGTAPAG